MLVIGTWALLSHYVFNRTTLPSPQLVLAEMIEIVADGKLWPNLSYTLTSAVMVFVISYPLGVLIGTLMGRSDWWENFFRDSVIAGLTTPVVVFVFIGLIFFGLARSGRVLIVCTAVIPLVIVNVAEGARNIPRPLMSMAQAFGVGSASRLRHILLPGMAPFLFSGARYGLAISLRGSAVVEIFGAQRGLGFQLIRAYEGFSVSRAIAWTFFIVLGVLVLEQGILQRLERYFFRWRQEAY